MARRASGPQQIAASQPSLRISSDPPRPASQHEIREKEKQVAALDLREATLRVLRLPAVADKTFLVAIGDVPQLRNVLSNPELDAADKAAVLACRLAWNHPLPDGNKRAAWACLVLFIDLNDGAWDPDLAVDPVAGRREALADAPRAGVQGRRLEGLALLAADEEEELVAADAHRGHDVPRNRREISAALSGA